MPAPVGAPEARAYAKVCEEPSGSCPLTAKALVWPTVMVTSAIGEIVGGGWELPDDSEARSRTHGWCAIVCIPNRQKIRAAADLVGVQVNIPETGSMPPGRCS